MSIKVDHPQSLVTFLIVQELVWSRHGNKLYPSYFCELPQMFTCCGIMYDDEHRHTGDNSSKVDYNGSVGSWEYIADILTRLNSDLLA